MILRIQYFNGNCPKNFFSVLVSTSINKQAPENSVQPSIRDDDNDEMVDKEKPAVYELQQILIQISSAQARGIRIANQARSKLACFVLRSKERKKRDRRKKAPEIQEKKNEIWPLRRPDINRFSFEPS